MYINSDFISAVDDFQLLIEKGYTSRNIIKLIGDRYKLNSIQRSMLYRGISTNNQAIRRKEKLILENIIVDNTLHVDAYNQILIINSYLKGKPTFVSFDGFIRDAGILKEKVSNTNNLERAIDLSLSYLNSIKPDMINICIDSPVKNSKEFAKAYKLLNSNYKLNINIKQSKKVDNQLINLKAGIIASADTVIIDNSNLSFFDLAKNTLKFHFNAKFINLQNITNPMLFS